MTDKFSIIYRPQTFDEVCGNTETVRLLKEKSRIRKIGKMIIIHGTSGIGKTTLIYILAKAHLCKNLKPDGNPCCECESCVQIQNSLYLTGNVPRGCGIEMFDMGKDGDEYGYINKIVSRVNAKYTLDKRVMIIEEMHNTSLKNQQKLNKSLEYIPDNLLILIPTSDYYTKISPHLKTRSDSYMLTNPDKNQIVDHLYNIAQKEIAKTGCSKVTKKDLEKLVALKNSNMRECVDTLPTLLDCGDIGKDFLMGDYNKRLRQFIEYLTAVKLGVIGLTEYVQNIPDKTLFLQSLPKLLEQGISLRSVANELVEPPVRKQINELLKDVSEIKVAKLIRTMPKMFSIQEDEARMHLWCIGIELNSAMSRQLNLSDEENSIDNANKQNDSANVDLLSMLHKGELSEDGTIQPFGGQMPAYTQPSDEEIDSLPGNTISGEFSIQDL